MSDEKKIICVKLEFFLKEIVAKRKRIYIEQVDDDIDDVTVREAIEVFEKVLASAPR